MRKCERVWKCAAYESLMRLYHTTSYHQYQTRTSYYQYQMSHLDKWEEQDPTGMLLWPAQGTSSRWQVLSVDKLSINLFVQNKVVAREWCWIISPLSAYAISPLSTDSWPAPSTHPWRGKAERATYREGGHSSESRGPAPQATPCVLPTPKPILTTIPILHQARFQSARFLVNRASLVGRSDSELCWVICGKDQYSKLL